MRELLRATLTILATLTIVYFVQQPEPPTRTKPARREAPERVDLQPLVARIATLEAELAELRDRPAVERVEVIRERVAAATPTAAVPADPRFDSLGSVELRARAAALRGVDAVDAWHALLRRDLDRAERRDALDSLARLHLKSEDYRSAATRLREALELEGSLATPKAHGMSHSLAWALAYDGDPRAARDELDRLLAEGSISESVEASARSAVAGWSMQIGDHDRARTEYAALVKRWLHGESEVLRNVAEAAQNQLTRLN